MAHLKITGLHKFYGSVHAVRGIDLEIPEGEFTVLVGPSGCGKSTLLRAIAGLEEVDRGTIEIAGRVVNDMRPRERNIAMVFQNYSLYPYLSVFENIAFGLRARKAPQSEIEARVKRAADMLGIANLLGRKPRELSGGQRQRVAIGRAIVRNARLFLFDEPLSNLDAQLRDEMRSEIKRLHQEIATTMIYVTHDQIEAMTLADRIVLLKEGQIEQVGTPLDLFERPATRYVAGFLGSPAMNFIDVGLAAKDAGVVVRLTDGTELQLPAARRSLLGRAAERLITLGIRPEHISRAHDGALREGVVRLLVIIELIQPTGSRTYVTFSLGGVAVVAEVEPHDVDHANQQLDMQIDMNRAVLIDPGTGRVL
jgi:multiple sugar transport system ATP-binding protein